MGLLSTSILALSMSADAFAASLGKGTEYRRPTFSKALRSGFIFGLIEGVTPIIGWLIGRVASQHLTTVDHWIAFFALYLLGVKMIYGSFRPAARDEANEVAEAKPSLRGLVFTAIATSIDALVVGVTLAFLDADIWLAAAAIGFSTFVMATLGMMIGQYAGKAYGPMAERLGGLGLILIGSFILYEHAVGQAGLG